MVLHCSPQSAPRSSGFFLASRNSARYGALIEASSQSIQRSTSVRSAGVAPVMAGA